MNGDSTYGSTYVSTVVGQITKVASDSKLQRCNMTLPPLET